MAGAIIEFYAGGKDQVGVGKQFRAACSGADDAHEFCH